MENKARARRDPPPVEAFDDRFVFGEFSEEFERSGAYLSPDKGLHAGYNFALLLATRCAPDHPRLSGDLGALSRALAVHRLFQS